MPETVGASRDLDLLVDSAEPRARHVLRMALDANQTTLTIGGLGLHLPINRCQHSDPGLIAHLGPDEWILWIAADAASSFAGEVAQALAGRFFSLVDVSCRDVAFILRGRRVREVLSGGCLLDLDANFPAGSATRTLFGKAEIVLVRPTSDEVYLLECARSYAPYVVALIQACALEFDRAIIDWSGFEASPSATATTGERP
jgi:sarcosine oxidase subunit gamma